MTILRVVATAAAAGVTVLLHPDLTDLDRWDIKVESNRGDIL